MQVCAHVIAGVILFLHFLSVLSQLKSRSDMYDSTTNKTFKTPHGMEGLNSRIHYSMREIEKVPKMSVMKKERQVKILEQLML